MRGREEGAAGVGDRDRGDRQVAAGAGSSTSTSTASPSPSTGTGGAALSYGEGVTYWALADMVRMRCRIARGGRAGVRAGEAALDAGGADPRSGGAGLPRASARAPARARRASGARPAGPVRCLAAVLRAARRELSDRARFRGHAMGRRFACSTSSSTCSTGRATRRSYVVTLARPELLERRPTWGAGQRNFTSLYLEPLSQEAMEELLTGLVPGLPRRSATGSSRAPRASRCTRSRRCGCCSTAARSSRRAPSTG